MSLPAQLQMFPLVGSVILHALFKAWYKPFSRLMPSRVHYYRSFFKFEFVAFVKILYFLDVTTNIMIMTDNFRSAARKALFRAFQGPGLLNSTLYKRMPIFIYKFEFSQFLGIVCSFYHNRTKTM